MSFVVSVKRHCWQQVFLCLVLLCWYLPTAVHLLPITPHLTLIDSDENVDHPARIAGSAEYDIDAEAKRNRTRLALNLACLAVFMFLSMSGAAIFYKLRDAPSIRHRQPYDTLLSVVSGSLLCTLILLREALLPHYPCWLMLWAGYILTPLNLWLISARSAMLAAVYCINKASAARIARQLQIRSNTARVVTTMTNEQQQQQQHNHRGSIVADLSQLSMEPSQAMLDTESQELQRLVKPDNHTSSSIVRNSGSPVRSSFPNHSPTGTTYLPSDQDWLRKSPNTFFECTSDAQSSSSRSTRLVMLCEKYRSLASTRNRIICLIVYLVVMSCLVAPIQYFSTRNAVGKFTDDKAADCVVGWERYALYAIVLIHPCVLLPGILFFTRKTQDNFGIWREGVIGTCITAVLYVAYVVCVFSLNVPGHTLGFIFAAQIILIQVITVWWPAFNEWQKRGCVKRLQDADEGGLSRVSFRAMIDDTLLFNQFKEFTLRDFSIENVLFIEACAAMLAILRSDVARVFGLPPDAPPSALDGSNLRRSNTVNGTNTTGQYMSIAERSNLQRKFASYYEVSQKTNGEMISTVVSCEVWYRLQLIYDVFLCEDSAMQVNLSDNMYRQLTRVITVAHNSHQLRVRNNACVCSNNENTLNCMYRCQCVTGEFDTWISPSSPRSSHASPQHHHHHNPSRRYSYSGDKRASMHVSVTSNDNSNNINKNSTSNAVVGWSTGVCKSNEAIPNRACTQSVASMSDDEIAELTMEKPAVATAVITTDSKDNLRDEVLSCEQIARIPSSNFNPMYAVAIIEEAREEIETLVICISIQYGCSYFIRYCA
ncbi:hypothetical protein BDF22DRAFT_689923 [Syncephalis plumigaleata]|nr:hypothetical protein BDF22DRAFT_689923 [Syncephalis plumigaleata]